MAFPRSLERRGFTLKSKTMSLTTRSIRERDSDYLKVEDYVWRWDTDWFWCSQYIFAHKPIIRRLLGPKRLNSVTYTRIMRWNRKYKIAHYWDLLRGFHSEAVIQDVEIPLERCAEFIDFYFNSIRFTPVINVIK